jgi:hypothetical protein
MPQDSDPGLTAYNEITTRDLVARMNAENSGESAEMPRYKCHKEVHALKINEVRQSPKEPAVDGGTWELVVGEGFSPITISHEWYTKHAPQAGGYYVVYADGYKSFSPAEAFEGGYARIT